ncbi:hypothetical protein CIHG_07063 [Coccidioides immitis H538.4]|uniref:Uncharacterized protein n=2 Tax=Coccidioides immitis TaxID=5501 RepID=A0A0J8QPD8_COCIT|nr:hypothetical protein CISG_03979 [Coccidioides immitis RMSCC 3703]KMU89131.1 hypothetical protein CIHG_07063 [Coccidioides immitis H538.4]
MDHLDTAPPVFSSSRIPRKISLLVNFCSFCITCGRDMGPRVIQCKDSIIQQERLSARYRSTRAESVSTLVVAWKPHACPRTFLFKNEFFEKSSRNPDYSLSSAQKNLTFLACIDLPSSRKNIDSTLPASLLTAKVDLRMNGIGTDPLHRYLHGSLSRCHLHFGLRANYVLDTADATASDISSLPLKAAFLWASNLGHILPGRTSKAHLNINLDKGFRIHLHNASSRALRWIHFSTVVMTGWIPRPNSGIVTRRAPKHRQGRRSPRSSAVIHLTSSCPTRTSANGHRTGSGLSPHKR